MSPDAPTPRRPLAGSIRLVRRVLAPAGLELEGHLADLQRHLSELRAEDAAMRDTTTELRDQLATERERVRALEDEVARLRDGLHEERRLHLRVAELTDLVTELVLPLHDREIDPAALRRLRPDTL